jgi:hypothetical protein
MPTHHKNMILNLSLSERFGEELSKPGHIAVNITADLEHRDVHAWFEVFSRVLKLAGFHEKSIAVGAAEIALNGTNETLAYILDEYDLVRGEEAYEKELRAEDKLNND